MPVLPTRCVLFLFCYCQTMIELIQNLDKKGLQTISEDNDGNPQELIVCEYVCVCVRV